MTVYDSKKPSLQIVSDKTFKTISSMMKDVMTAAVKEFSVDFGGIDVAGMISETRIPVKEERSKTDYNVSVAGFFPGNHPQWAVGISTKEG